MKRSIFLSFFFFVIGVAVTVLLLGNPFHWHWVNGLHERTLTALNPSPEKAEAGEQQLWTCSMHPEVIREEPGDCPLCGMTLTPLKSPVGPQTDSSRPPEERKIKHWRAPMDPTYISDKPGKSPMGMDLIPVYEGEEEKFAAGTVRIDPVFVQNIGVQSTEVKRTDIPFSIRTIGTLVYNDNQVFWVNTKYAGWIEKVEVNYVGEPVKAGQKLFEIYSPQLVTTQKEYLQALDYAERLSRSEYPDIVARARSLLEASRQRLRYWDITEEQIRALEKSRELFRTLTVVSPVSGLVVGKMDQALEGMYAKVGMNLYKIADLSTIWVEAEVFEHQIPWLKLGQEALINISYQPGKRYRGSIRYIYPFLNNKTRTLKVSIELPNPGQELRADMYVNVTFDVPSARGVLAVPEETVIHSGERNIVVLDRGEGRFQVKEVTLGLNGNGLWEVTKGLKRGDRVVVSSQFLIDSESNLKEAIRKIVSSGEEGVEVKP
ncbi:efflux RND transporter periplasmic adaptor subunit [Acidobacteria bacterium AH-259-D05]|nr:efflux RND transporter periplasmic adaptor subunit [Acidobacteria bacterium AH-259-D05]